LDSEEEIIIAFLFKRSGKSKLKESEIYLPLSLELGWFSTKEARQFVEYAIKQKLLIEKEGLLTPSFDIEKIDITVGFSPSKSTFKVKEKVEEEDVFQKIVNRIIEKTNNTYEEIIKDINRIQKEKNIIPEVAALLLAKEFNVNVEDSLDAVEKRIFRENEV
jgi:hypothetical protein